MCGIIGYKGTGNTGEIILNALKNMDYRGYDSVGVAAVLEGRLDVRKDKGRVSEVAEKLGLSSMKGNLAVGHTRWSTHGSPSKENAHPHLDCTGRLAVVHNGIIENFQELRKSLASHKMSSETDTELLPHLIEENIHLGLKEASMSAFRKLEGRNAFVVIDKNTQEMVGIRNGSPLIMGIGKDETFLCSDILAFISRTRDVKYLDDNEMVVVGPDTQFFSIITGQPIEKRLVRIDWDPALAEKGDYPHFLIKEIMEQKDTIQRAINQSDEDILNIVEKINSAYGTFFTGCGTAANVGMTGEYLFSDIAKKHINFVVASEFPQYTHFLRPETLLIAISQSGETADVLEAVEAAKKKGTKILSIVNVEGSTLDRMSDFSFLINAGPEKAVASTKATTSQLALVTLLAFASAGKLKEGKRLLIDAAGEVNDMLNPRYDYHIKNLAERLKNEDSIYIIGRSLNYPVAKEAAIKIMEVSRIHAQGFAGGELKHGPLALIRKGTPCIVFVANDRTKRDVLNNAIEIKARGGMIIGVSPENNEVFDRWIKVPDVGPLSPIVNIIPIQILAYHLGIMRGCDPDYCANLAKSVVVK